MKGVEKFIQAKFEDYNPDIAPQKTLRIVLPLEVQAQFNMFFETEALSQEGWLAPPNGLLFPILLFTHSLALSLYMYTLTCVTIHTCTHTHTLVWTGKTAEIKNKIF